MKKKDCKNRDKVLDFLINQNGNNNTSVFAKKDLGAVKLSEKQAVRALNSLETDGLLKIKKKSIHDDLSVPWYVELSSPGIHYFENKQENRKNNRRDWIKTYIPITISTIALIKSFLPEITLGMKLLLQLLK